MDYRKLAQDALEARERLVTEARSINDDTKLSEAEKRERIEKIDADIQAKTDEARGLIEQGEREAETRDLAERAGKLVVPSLRSTEDTAESDFNDQFRAIARGELRHFDVQVAEDELRAARAALLSDSANAGTTVAGKFVAEVLKSLEESSPFLQTGVRVITTANGEKMEWPVKNGKLIAARVNENAVYGKSNMSFTRTQLDAYKYGVIAEASEEMLNDSALPLASLIAEDIGEAIADATAADWLLGDGVGDPQGLLTGLTLGLTGGTIANTLATATAFDNIIKLQHSVIEKYRRNAVWITSDDAVLQLRLVKDNDGRYIWQDGVTPGAVPTLLGKPVYTDPNMPAPTEASKKVLTFGDMKRCYVVRFVRGVNVKRSDEYGFDKDIVAWKGSVRIDGAVQDGAACAALSTPAA